MPQTSPIILALTLQAAVAAPLLAAQPAKSPFPSFYFEHPTSPEPELTGIEQAAPVWSPPPHESRPLRAAPAQRGASSSAESPTSPRSIASDPVVRTLGSLALVIAIILGLRWFLTRASRITGGLRSQLGAGGRAPAGILQILARYPIARGQTLVLLKLDRRVLLLNQTPEGFKTLSEVIDTDEVASILRACRDEEGLSMASRFSSLLSGLERDPSIADTDDLRATAQPVRLIPDAPDPDMHAEFTEEDEQQFQFPSVADAESELRRRLSTLREYAR